MSNIIRTIKILSFNGELDNISEQEKFFLSTFNNANECVIGDKTHFTRSDQLSDYSLYVLNIKEKYLIVEYLRIWNQLENKFDMDDNDIETMIVDIFKRRFNINLKNVIMAGSHSSKLRMVNY